MYLKSQNYSFFFRYLRTNQFILVCKWNVSFQQHNIMFVCCYRNAWIYVFIIIRFVFILFYYIITYSNCQTLICFTRKNVYRSHFDPRPCEFVNKFMTTYQFINNIGFFYYLIIFFSIRIIILLSYRYR